MRKLRLSQRLAAPLSAPARVARLEEALAKRGNDGPYFNGDRICLVDAGYGAAGRPGCNILPAPAAYASTTNDECLVQDVDKHLSSVRTMLDDFGFLPGWRLDDIMVSVAAPAGSVGAHVDAYDVFLAQIAGSRRWQIGSQIGRAHV